MDVTPTDPPERLEIDMLNKSIKLNETVQFQLSFYNSKGDKTTPPQGISWSSLDKNIAEVNANGVATGKGVGQTTIKATYQNLEVSVLLTVVADDNQVATVTLDAVREIGFNQNITLQAMVKNNAGQTITGQTVTWQSDNTSLVTVDAQGKVTGVGYGTANIRASVNGIMSNAAMIQVFRTGTFANGSTGVAKLKVENGVLKLQVNNDYSTSNSPPDLRIYLSNNANSGAAGSGALEIATLTQRNGAQSWNLPSNVTITQYRYVLVWCKQLGGLYGRADLGT